jgi:DNA adenine methylase
VTAVKPPISWFGGKTRLAPAIAARLPPHGHYVEPFGGSLAVLLAKPRSAMETVSDLDGSLMAFWRVLRDRPAELERACALTPHARAELALAAELDGLDDLERARRVWVRLTQGRSGQLHHLTGWRHYQDPNGSSLPMPAYLGAYAARLAPAAARLSGVSLERLPALDLVARYGRHRDVLVYADPPYLDETRATSGSNSYPCEMRAEGDHRELAGALRACHAAVVLSGYGSPLYAELYEGWHRAEIGGYAGNGAGKRAEVLWSNRPFSQATLFDGLEAGEAS